MRSLVTSIFLYACESWTLTPELHRRIQATEMRCYRKIIHISYKDHVINEEVRAKIQQAIGPHEDLLTIVKRRKLQWYGHVTFICSGQNHLARYSERGKKTRQRDEEVGRQHQGMDRLGVRQVPQGSGEQGKMEKTCCKIISGAPTTLAVKRLMMNDEPSLPTPFYPVLLPISIFIALSTVFLSLNSSDNSLLSHSVLPVLFPPYWSFQLSISV